MKCSTRRAILRTPAWVPSLVGVITIVYATGVTAYWHERGGSLASIGMALIAALFALGFADSLLTRLDLNEHALTIRTLQGVKTIARESIASVSWEAGVGVALKLVDGASVKQPYLGNGQKCASAIRAWLKSTTRGNAE